MKKLEVWLNSWENYNKGFEGSGWIELPMDEEELEEICSNLGEEIFIQDVSDDFGFGIDELDDVFDINNKLDGLSDDELEELSAICEELTFTEAYEVFESGNYVYYPEMTLEDLAYEMVQEFELSDFALRYFDYKQFARDLSFEGYYETENGVLEIM